MTAPDDARRVAERCEQATGPDREIDRDIALMLGLYDRPEDMGGFRDPAEAVVGGGGQTYAALPYTASLDAALTLLMGPDWEWSLEACEGSLFYSEHERQMVYRAELGDPLLHMEAEAATAALAFVAASLKARAALAVSSSPVQG